MGEAMAQSEHLPIDKATYDLCLYLDQVVRGFPRYHKYSLGADLREATHLESTRPIHNSRKQLRS